MNKDLPVHKATPDLITKSKLTSKKINKMEEFELSFVWASPAGMPKVHPHRPAQTNREAANDIIISLRESCGTICII